jgi:hypothetical protein
MEFIKKLLILLIFVLFCYILLRLLQKRTKLLVESTKEGFTEGLNEEYIDPQVKKIIAGNKVENSIINMVPAYGSQPIKNFFVKSSLDSAYNGSNVSLDMVNYILSRGYRFLDFEVYLEPLSTEPVGTSSIAVVGYSQFGNYPRMSENNIKFSDVIRIIRQGAFTSTSPNPTDPVFLQIRPMYHMINPSDDAAIIAAKKGKNTQLNTQIETALEELASGSNILAGVITPNSTLSSLSGKVVVIMDTTTTTGQKSKKLLSMISIDPKSKNMTINNTGIVTAEPITQKETPGPNKEPNPLIEVLPFDDKGAILTDNPNVNTVLIQFTPNFSPVMAWYYNSSSDILATYEKLFVNNGNSAFIELSSLVSNAAKNMTLNSGIVGPS